MTFTYKYRDRDGSAITGSVEASGRSDAYGKLKASGISPISLKETHGNPKTGQGINSGSKWCKIALFGLLVAAGAGSVLFLGTGSENTTVQKPVPPKKKAVKKEPKAVVHPRQEPQPAKTNAPAALKPEPTRKLTSEERIELIENKILEKKMDLSTPTNNRAFRTGFEQQLAAIFTTPLGAPPPPMPLRLTPVTYLRLQEILDAPNTVFEDDSDRVAEAKMAVAVVKKELKDYISKGGDPEKFLEHYYSELKQASDEWKAAQMELVRTMKTDPGLAATLEAELNEHFSQKGIRPVRMPPKLKERYGIK